MYNKKTLTFTFHHYWGGFLSGGFCLRGAFVLDPKSTQKMNTPRLIVNIYIYMYFIVYCWI